MKAHDLILVLLVFSYPAYGWQPCLPFCDSGCGGAALQALGASVSTSLQGQGSTNQQLLQGINDTTESTVNLGTDLVDVWTTGTIDLLGALEARTAKIELANIGTMKAHEFSTDAINNFFSQALREMFLAENISGNNKDFSKLALSETGELLANNSKSIKESYLKSIELGKEISSVQNIYSNELSLSDSAKTIKKSFYAKDDIYKSQIIHCETTYSEEELLNIQTLITYIVNPSPLPILSTGEMISANTKAYELDRRVYNSKLSLITAIVNQVISGKAQFTNPEFVSTYVSRSTSKQKLSMTESFDSLVKGRISSEGWFLNINIQTKTGINREIAYLNAEENTLLFLLSQRREWRNQLMGLLTIQSLHQKKEELDIDDF